MNGSILLGVAAIAVAGLAGCNQARGEEDKGPTVSRNYPVAAFDRIAVGGPYEVTVRTGSAPTVSATGGQRDIERMVVEVDGQTLKIHPVRRKGFNFTSWSNRDVVRLTVTVPQLAGAEIAGSGNIEIDRVAGDSFAGAVAGSGDLQVGQVAVKQLKLGIAGSGEIRAAAGSAGTASYDIAGSGDINAGELVAEVASVSIAGSGNVAAHATGSAKVDIAGSGNVDLKGGAKCSVSKAGSGNVRCS